MVYTESIKMLLSFKQRLLDDPYTQLRIQLRKKRFMLAMAVMNLLNIQEQCNSY